jgi:hypothetical protein
VTGVRLSRHTIDLRHEQSLTVTVTAHDSTANGAASGIARVGVDAFTLKPSPRLLSPHLRLVRGTVMDGTWRGTLKVPLRGSWKFTNVFAIDAAHNTQDYTHKGRGRNAGSPTDFVLHAGWQTSFRATGHLPAVHHVRPGGLTSFSFSPRHVDTRQHAERVHVTATFAKPTPTAVFATFKGGSDGIQHRNWIHSDAKLSRRANGTWRGSFRVGTWEGNLTAFADVSQLYGGNVSPPDKSESAGGLARRGFPRILRITSREDDTTPVLTGLAVSPSSVDTTSGAQPITVTATAHDQTGTGMAADAYLSNPNGGVGSDLSIELTRRPGTDTFVGTKNLRECVPGGAWRIEIGLDDNAHNQISYSPDQLAAMQLPNTIHVTSSPGDIVPPRAKAVTSVADHTLTLTFSEGVENVDDSTVHIYPLSPPAARFHPVPITTVTCSTDTATVDCSGRHGLVTSAVLTIPQLTSGTQYSVFANIDGVAPQLTDGNGNPLAWSRRVDRVKAS